MSEIRQKVRDYIRNALSEMEDSGPFTDQSLLFSTGRLESLCAVELILFLEKEFDLSTGDPAFDVNLLDSVDEIVSLIEVR